MCVLGCLFALTVTFRPVFRPSEKAGGPFLVFTYTRRPPSCCSLPVLLDAFMIRSSPRHGE